MIIYFLFESKSIAGDKAFGRNLLRAVTDLGDALEGKVAASGPAQGPRQRPCSRTPAPSTASTSTQSSTSTPCTVQDVITSREIRTAIHQRRSLWEDRGSYCLVFGAHVFLADGSGLTSSLAMSKDSRCAMQQTLAARGVLLVVKRVNHDLRKTS